MTTINHPEQSRSGRVRPFGYHYATSHASQATTVIGVPSDVLQIGIQIKATAASYFLEGSMSTEPEITAGSGDTWFDLVGDGSIARTSDLQLSMKTGVLSAIRLRTTSATSVKINVEMRRV